MDNDAILEKVTDAIERQNYDYAIELLSHLLDQNPKDLKARQMIWATERRKFAAAGSKVSAFKTLGPWVAAAIHSLTGKHDQIIKDCERYLVINPESAVMRDKLAQAALEGGDMELAIAAYESAREVDPTNVACLRQLGRLYKEKFETSRKREDMTLAMQRFEELQRLRPLDHEAKSAAQMLAAQRAIEDGGWTEADSARELIRDKDAAAELQERDRLVKGEDEADRELKKVEEALKKEPSRAQHWIRQGDLQLQKNRFKSAEESFRKAMELQPENTFTRARLGDVKIRFMKTRIEQIKEKLAANAGDAELKKQLADQAKQLLDFQIVEFRQRVHDQPTNMEVHHLLGQFLLAAGEYDEAMSMFQKSVADPRYRMGANQMLGKCMVAKGMYDRAISMFTRAVEGTVVMNQTVKGIYYDLGETYEKVQDWTAAEKAFGKIYDADVSYRDVAAKMEAVYKKAREKKA